MKGIIYMTNGVRLHEKNAKKNIKHRPNMLWRKLYRDYLHNLGQCALILLMCVLGALIFSGLDGTARLMDVSVEKYYNETVLADLWIRGSMFSHEDIMNIKKLDSVADLQERVTAEFHTRGLGEDRVLLTHAVDGDFRICVPVIKEGSMMKPDDIRGCMIDERFALANGLGVGDPLTLDIYGTKIKFTIRALVAASEHMYISRSIQADPVHYSYVYISHKAVGELPFNEIIVKLKPGASLAAAETLLDDMYPAAIVIDREANQSTKAITENAEVYNNMLKVFPIFYDLAVIMFIASTVARMIGSQRIEIGTMYGLGLSSFRIAAHYIVYTTIPAFAGALIGMLAGKWLIPEIMWSIQLDNCNYPGKIYPPISVGTWLVTVLLVLVNIAICCFSLSRISAEAKASLLRPKAAVKGNHVLLEKWRWLWVRISWCGKIVVRNLMRRKFRTFVTLIGVFCCNALLLASMGLSESVEYFVDRYFHGTVQYNFEAEVTGGETLEYYRNRLDAGTVDGMMVKQATACTDTEKRIVNLYILADDQTTLKIGENNEYMMMPEHGAAVSRKTAEVLKLKKGDSVSLWFPGDEKELPLTVVELADNDLKLGIYIGRRQWESFRRGSFIPDLLQIRGPSASDMQFLRESDDVEVLRNPDDEYWETLSFMNNLRSVFTLLRVSALGFGLVACYSMGIISFIERKKEYAVQRVLGCRWGVLIRQILTENGLIAVVGVLLSVYPGILLMRVSLKFSEGEDMMLRPFISWQTAVAASVLSLLFSLLIALVIAAKLRKMRPVDDLKSVD